MSETLKPSTSQVAGQLKRISRLVFSAAPKQASLLAIIVESTLAGRTISEAELGEKLDPGAFRGDSHKERASVSIVRGKVKQFYEGLGSSDLVRITLPPGPPYTAVFSFHEGAETIRLYRQGLSYLEGGQARFVYGAQRFLGQALGAWKSSLDEVEEIVLVWVSAVLKVAIIAPVIEPEHVKSRPMFMFDLDHAIEVTSNLKNSAEVRILQGALHLLRLERKEAAAQFKAALIMDAERTKQHPWYAAYLMAQGETAVALRIIDDYQANDPNDAQRITARLLFRYLTGGETEDLFEAIVPTANLDLEMLSLLQALIWLDAGYHESIPDLLSEIRPMRELDWSGFCNSERLNDAPAPDLFIGMKVAALVNGRKVREAKKEMASHGRLNGVSSLQMAVGSLALGKSEQAIADLEQAYIRKSPLLNWLHLMPMFKPLGTHGRFKRLIDEIAGRMA